MFQVEVYNGFVPLAITRHRTIEAALDKADEFTVGTITITHPDGTSEVL